MATTPSYYNNNGSNLLSAITTRFPDAQFLMADGLDHAIIGFDEISERLIYSVELIIAHYIEYDGMKPDEADEFFQFNVFGAHVGEKTPIWSFNDY